MTRDGVTTTTTRSCETVTTRVAQPNGDWTETAERAGISTDRSHDVQSGTTTERQTRPGGAWTEEIRGPDSSTSVEGDQSGWTRRVRESGGTRIEETRNPDGSVVRATTGPDGTVDVDSLGSSATADLIDSNPQVQRILGTQESGELTNFIRDRNAPFVNITPPADETVIGSVGSRQISVEPPTAIAGGVRLPVEVDTPFGIDAPAGHVDLTVRNGRLVVNTDLASARNLVNRFFPASADPQNPNAWTSDRVLAAMDEYSAKLQERVNEINAELAGQQRRITDVSITATGEIRIEAERQP